MACPLLTTFVRYRKTGKNTTDRTRVTAYILYIVCLLIHVNSMLNHTYHIQYRVKDIPLFIKIIDTTLLIRSSSISDVVCNHSTNRIVRKASTNKIVRKASIINVVSNHSINTVVRKASITEVVFTASITEVVRRLRITVLVRKAVGFVIQCSSKISHSTLFNVASKIPVQCFKNI